MTMMMTGKTMLIIKIVMISEKTIMLFKIVMIWQC